MEMMKYRSDTLKVKTGINTHMHLTYIFLKFFLYRRGSAIILLVFHSCPVRTIGPPSVGGGGGGWHSSQRPFSLVPLTGFKPM